MGHQISSGVGGWGVEFGPWAKSGPWAVCLTPQLIRVPLVSHRHLAANRREVVGSIPRADNFLCGVLKFCMGPLASSHSQQTRMRRKLRTVDWQWQKELVRVQMVVYPCNNRKMIKFHLCLEDSCDKALVAVATPSSEEVAIEDGRIDGNAIQIV